MLPVMNLYDLRNGFQAAVVEPGETNNDEKVDGKGELWVSHHYVRTQKGIR